ncbi:MAG: dihydrolipoamide acetyltransferase family protein [Elusimicrobiota bacterium]
MNYEFKLPDIGEGLTEGELVKWHVKEGDTVKENDPICNVLTDKAEVEIPSPKNGKIVKLAAKVGEKVKVHATLVTIETAGTAVGQAVAAGSPSVAAPSAEEKAPEAAAAGISATPAVRKLASDLKVDISHLSGSGPGGRITEDDVRGASKGGASTNGSVKLSAAEGLEEKTPFIGIRRRTGEKMAQSWRTIPHVTHMDEADFTALLELRQELKAEGEKRGVKLTYLPFIVKALVKTFKEFPNFNAVLDEAAGAIIRKKIYNIGIAASTPSGLMVPVVKNVEKKDAWTLAADIHHLAEKARAGKIEATELSGGTFTVTNIGPIGGLFATPIINYPEAAILGVMKLQYRPVAREGQVQIRPMVNLVLAFDHRIIDGAEAANFMNTLVKHLENPRTLL